MYCFEWHCHEGSSEIFSHSDKYITDVDVAMAVRSAKLTQCSICTRTFSAVVWQCSVMVVFLIAVLKCHFLDDWNTPLRTIEQLSMCIVICVCRTVLLQRINDDDDDDLFVWGSRGNRWPHSTTPETAAGQHSQRTDAADRQQTDVMWIGIICIRKQFHLVVDLYVLLCCHFCV